jgi:hypothetical protein
VIYFILKIYKTGIGSTYRGIKKRSSYEQRDYIMWYIICDESVRIGSDVDDCKEYQVRR